MKIRDITPYLSRNSKYFSIEPWITDHLDHPVEHLLFEGPPAAVRIFLEIFVSRVEAALYIQQYHALWEEYSRQFDATSQKVFSTEYWRLYDIETRRQHEEEFDLIFDPIRYEYLGKWYDLREKYLETLYTRLIKVLGTSSSIEDSIESALTLLRIVKGVYTIYYRGKIYQLREEKSNLPVLIINKTTVRKSNAMKWFIYHNDNRLFDIGFDRRDLAIQYLVKEIEK